jgi:hypothetical protein
MCFGWVKALIKMRCCCFASCESLGRWELWCYSLMPQVLQHQNIACERVRLGSLVVCGMWGSWCCCCSWRGRKRELNLIRFLLNWIGRDWVNFACSKLIKVGWNYDSSIKVRCWLQRVLSLSGEMTHMREREITREGENWREFEISLCPIIHLIPKNN